MADFCNIGHSGGPNVPEPRRHDRSPGKVLNNQLIFGGRDDAPLLKQESLQ